jgi:hypothetical protein
VGAIQAVPYQRGDDESHSVMVVVVNFPLIPEECIGKCSPAPNMYFFENFAHVNVIYFNLMVEATH